MIITPLKIDGLLALSSEHHTDERGRFVRLYDSRFLKNTYQFNYISVAHNDLALTLRGLHFQENPYGETKIVHCVKGSIFDVAVDLRRDSPTFGNYCSINLGEGSEYQGLFIPKGFAHGYLTMRDQSIVHYMMDAPYEEKASRGVPWNDASIGIDWPAIPRIVSKKDLAWPSLLPK